MLPFKEGWALDEPVTCSWLSFIARGVMWRRVLRWTEPFENLNTMFHFQHIKGKEAFEEYCSVLSPFNLCPMVSPKLSIFVSSKLRLIFTIVRSSRVLAVVSLLSN